jgi:hypothetical protein
MKLSKAGWLVGGGAALLVGAAGAYPPNGYGPDPDGDSNPATNTQLFARIGDAAEAALDPPFQIVTFEAKYQNHGEAIRSQKAGERTVKFSKGLKRQICEGQLYFRYDTECTYMAAPSGKFAAVYRDDWGRPLIMRFEKPVCAAALALYPTGGEEGERYNVSLQPYGAAGKELTPASYQFEWTKDTFRWRLMAGAFFLNEKAERVDVNIESMKDPKKVVRFLIDDVAFIEDNCLQALANINAEAGARVKLPAGPPAQPSAPATAPAVQPIDAELAPGKTSTP